MIFTLRSPSERFWVHSSRPFLVPLSYDALMVLLLWQTKESAGRRGRDEHECAVERAG